MWKLSTFEIIMVIIAMKGKHRYHNCAWSIYAHPVWCSSRAGVREHILERQRDCVEIAKAEDKNKGCKPMVIDETKFRAVCICWRAGEIAATVAMPKMGLNPNTFSSV